METLFILVPLSLVGIGAIAALLGWAIHSGQYDDLARAAQSVLWDDDTGAARDTSREDGDRDRA